MNVSKNNIQDFNIKKSTHTLPIIDRSTDSLLISISVDSSLVGRAGRVAPDLGKYLSGKGAGDVSFENRKPVGFYSCGLGVVSDSCNLDYFTSQLFQ